MPSEDGPRFGVWETLATHPPSPARNGIHVVRVEEEKKGVLVSNLISVPESGCKGTSMPQLQCSLVTHSQRYIRTTEV